MPDPAEAVRNALGARVDEVAHVPTHEYNEVYRVRADGVTFIVKFDTRWRVIREPWAYEQARAVGIPVPDVLATDPDAADPFMIVSEAPGVELHTFEAPFEAKTRAFRQLGTHMRALHSIPARGSGFLVEDALREGRAQGNTGSEAEVLLDDNASLRYLNEHEMLSDDEAAAVDRLVREGAALFVEGPSALLHADLVTSHVFVDPTDVSVSSVIDFGDVRVGDPAWDFVCMDIHEPEVLPFVLQGYAPDDVMREMLPAKIAVLRLVRLVGEVRWCHERDLEHARQIRAIRAALS